MGMVLDERQIEALEKGLLSVYDSVVAGTNMTLDGRYWVSCDCYGTFISEVSCAGEQMLIDAGLYQLGDEATGYRRFYLVQLYECQDFVNEPCDLVGPNKIERRLVSRLWFDSSISARAYMAQMMMTHGPNWTV